MSIAIMARVWDKSERSGSELVLLLALADRADEDGISWPGMEYLAKRCNLTLRQTKRIAHKLEQFGEVYINYGGGKKTTNRYLVTLGLDLADIIDILVRRFGKDHETAEIIAAGIKNGTPVSQFGSSPNSDIEDTVKSPNSDIEDTVSNSDTGGTVKSPNSDIEDTVKSPYGDIQDPIQWRGRHPIHHDTKESIHDFLNNGQAVNSEADKLLIAKEIWGQALERLQGQMTKAQYDTHFKPTEATGLSADFLLVAAASDSSQQILEKRLAKVASRAVSSASGGALTRVIFSGPEGGNHAA